MTKEEYEATMVDILKQRGMVVPRLYLDPEKREEDETDNRAGETTDIASEGNV